VAHEIPVGTMPEPLRIPRRAREIGLVGLDEAEQIAIKLAARLHAVDIEAEMAEAADLERPVEHDPADIVALTVSGHTHILLMPKATRGDRRALGHRLQLLERDVGVELAIAGKGAKTAIAAGDDPLAPDDAGKPAQPLGDQL